MTAGPGGTETSVYRKEEKGVSQVVGGGGAFQAEGATTTKTRQGMLSVHGIAQQQCEGSYEAASCRRCGHTDSFSRCVDPEGPS